MAVWRAEQQATHRLRRKLKSNVVFQARTYPDPGSSAHAIRQKNIAKSERHQNTRCEIWNNNLKCSGGMSWARRGWSLPRRGFASSWIHKVCNGLQFIFINPRACAIIDILGSDLMVPFKFRSDVPQWFAAPWILFIVSASFAFGPSPLRRCLLVDGLCLHGLFVLSPPASWLILRIVSSGLRLLGTVSGVVPAPVSPHTLLFTVDVGQHLFEPAIHIGFA